MKHRFGLSRSLFPLARFPNRMILGELSGTYSGHVTYPAKVMLKDDSLDTGERRSRRDLGVGDAMDSSELCFDGTTSDV